MKAMLFVAVASMAAVVLPAAAEAEKPKLVVMPLQASGLPEPAAAMLDELLVDLVRRLEQHEVIGKTDIDAMLGLENMKDQLGCDDVACAAEIGGALGAEFLVAGRVAKMGDNIIIVLKLINSVQSKVLGSVKHKAPNDENLYDKAIEEAGFQLFGLKEAPKIEKEPAGSVRLTTEPLGAAMFLNDKPVAFTPLSVSRIRPR